MIIGIFSAYLLNKPIISYIAFIIFFSGLEISIFFNGIYFPIKIKKHPYIENPEEIKKLKVALETEKIKKIINALYQNHGRNVYEIAWMIEKNLNIELHIRKGLRAGEIKSGELYKKIDKILGINTRDFWDSTIRHYYEKPISHYIRDIFILLSLFGGIISLLLVIIFDLY